MHMQLNIKEMIDGGPSRLRYVFRYSTSRVNHQESVAEHSYYVCLYCLMVSRWVQEHPHEDKPFAGDVKVENLLQRALLHDLEEARSGDFPRPFKHSNPALKEMLATASREAFIQIIEPVTGLQADSPQRELDSDLSDTDGDVTDEYIYSWLTSKDGTIEGRILEFCDFLAVVSFMMAELQSGNKGIHQHVKVMDSYFRTFAKPEYEFLKPLIKQTQSIMQEIFQ